MKKNFVLLIFAMLISGCSSPNNNTGSSHGQVSIDAGEAFIKVTVELENAATSNGDIYSDVFRYDYYQDNDSIIEKAYLNDEPVSGSLFKNWALDDICFQKQNKVTLPIYLHFTIQNLMETEIEVGLNDHTTNWTGNTLTLDDEIALKSQESGNIRATISPDNQDERIINGGNLFFIELVTTLKTADPAMQEVKQSLDASEFSYDDFNATPASAITMHLEGHQYTNLLGKMDAPSTFIKKSGNQISAFPHINGEINDKMTNTIKLNFKKDHYYLYRLDYRASEVQLKKAATIRVYPQDQGCNLANSYLSVDEKSIFIVNKYNLEDAENVAFAVCFYSESSLQETIIYDSFLVVDLGEEMPTNYETLKTDFAYFSYTKVTGVDIVFLSSSGDEHTIGRYIYSSSNPSIDLNYTHQDGDIVEMRTINGCFGIDYQQSFLIYKTLKTN